MKKIIILILLFLISFGFNIYQKYENIKFKKINSNYKVELINKNDCYIMYANYYLNQEGIEFDLLPVKNCLLNDIFNKAYDVNGVDQKILLDLSSQKNNLEKELINKYVKKLKERFYMSQDTVDYNSMSIALNIINDNQFIKELLEKSLIGEKKRNLIFYMKEYKKNGGDKEYLLEKLEKIKFNLVEYNYYGDENYDNLKAFFSK